MSKNKRYEISVGWRVVLCVALYVLAIHAPKLHTAMRQYVDMTDSKQWRKERAG